jgi:hypothetical protein
MDVCSSSKPAKTKADRRSKPSAIADDARQSNYRHLNLLVFRELGRHSRLEGSTSRGGPKNPCRRLTLLRIRFEPGAPTSALSQRSLMNPPMVTNAIFARSAHGSEMLFRKPWHGRAYSSVRSMPATSIHLTQSDLNPPDPRWQAPSRSTSGRCFGPPCARSRDSVETAGVVRLPVR